MSDVELTSITLTEAARVYLRELLDRQETPGMGVRIFVENPGTPRAECCMAYCAPGEQDSEDHLYPQGSFDAYIEAHSLPYLKDAVIDYHRDRMGGQLTFKAPHSKVPNLGPDASLEERINHVLYAEINPGLAAHGGHVSLIELFEDAEQGWTAVLKFGGGCQGCSAIDLTLRDGVEATLRERIPQLSRVTDTTDHSVKDQAYYR